MQFQFDHRLKSALTCSTLHNLELLFLLISVVWHCLVLVIGHICCRVTSSRPASGLSADTLWLEVRHVLGPEALPVPLSTPSRDRSHVEHFNRSTSSPTGRIHGMVVSPEQEAEPEVVRHVRGGNFRFVKVWSAAAVAGILYVVDFSASRASHV